MDRRRSRAALLAAGALVLGLAPAAAPARVLRDVPYGDAPAQRLDVYRVPAPRSAAPRPAVLVVHGGGWAHGSKRRMAPIAAALARAGFVALAVDYTLARPGVPGFPRQPRELRRAVRWIRANAAWLRVDPRRVGVLGSSAGGHLAALLALDAAGPLTAGARVRALATWSAPLDLPALHPRWQGGIVDAFLGCAAGACPDERALASPLAHVTPDDPPILLVNAREEIVPAAQAVAMAGRLAADGVPQRLLLLAGAAHGRELASLALHPTIAFLQRRL